MSKPVEKMSVKQFFARFPDDDACLAHVMEDSYGLRHICGKCGKDATFHRLANRRAYSCAACGVHVYPCAGTVFEDSRTSLQSWFYAIYLFVVTRHGVSGKELQRTLGVASKTAWRMRQQIRILMGNTDAFAMLPGLVELDEAYVGGKRDLGAAGKTIVMGLKGLDGRITPEIIPSVKSDTLRELTCSPFSCRL